MIISIIITNYKTPGLLKLCIESIQKSLPAEMYEIIVVDSESEDETQEMILDFLPTIKFIPFRKNMGFPKLINAGIEKSSTDSRYILMLNADIIVLDDAVEKIIKFMENNPNIGIVGPKLLSFNNDIQFSCFRFYTPWTILCRRTFLGKTRWGEKILKNFLMQDWDHKGTKDVDWVQGSAMMVRREALAKIGLMDERFFMYFEDVDLCRRFWENGYRVTFYPEASMHHYHGQASASKKSFVPSFLNRYVRIHIISALKYFLKYRNKKFTRLVRT